MGSVNYKKKRIPGTGKTMDMHRFILQEYLGRDMDNCEAVHHCNGDKRDNRIENLELMLLSEHARMHQTKPLTHGTWSGYHTHMCRCTVCFAYKQRINANRYRVGGCRARLVSTG